MQETGKLAWKNCPYSWDSDRRTFPNCSQTAPGLKFRAFKRHLRVFPRSSRNENQITFQHAALSDARGHTGALRSIGCTQTQTGSSRVVSLRPLWMAEARLRPRLPSRGTHSTCCCYSGMSSSARTRSFQPECRTLSASGRPSRAGFISPV